MATHSSILAWKIHGQRSLVGYSSWGTVHGVARVGHDLATKPPPHLCKIDIFTAILPQKLNLREVK